MADGRRRDPSGQPSGRRHEVGLGALFRRLESSLGLERVDRYFKRDAQLTVTGNVVAVHVPSPFHKGLIERRFGGLLSELVSECFGPGYRPEITVAADRFTHAAAPQNVSETKPVAARGVAKRIARSTEQIDSRFDLDRFIVGTSNRVAYDAALRVAQGNDDDAFGRLFIHGVCGVGKSHLLRGIARRRATEPGAEVRCVAAEAFTNEYIQAVQNNRVEAFRRRYRRVDLLCIDDVHFFAGKNATQVELLHTLDAIELGGAKLVLASDAHPHRITEMTRALASRFVSGMVVQIDIPDPELRGRLIRESALHRGLQLTDGAVAVLRDGPGQAWSAREVQGAMTRLHAAANLEGLRGPMTPSDVERLLRGSVRPDASTPVRYDQIRDAVCRPLEVETSELGKSGRHPRVVMARALITLLCRELTTMSYPEIARALGKRNHSTVITAHQRIEAQMDDSVSLGLADDGLTISQLRDRMREGIHALGGVGR